MTAPSPLVIAVITGERGQREIVRPLTAVGVSCVVLDWEELRERGGAPHARFVPALWKIVRDNPGEVVFTDMSSIFLALILLAARLHGSRVFLRLRGDPVAETHDQLRFHWEQREWPQLCRAVISWLLDRPLFALVDHFVPVSEWIVRRLAIADRASIVRVPILLEQFPRRQHGAVSPLRLLAVTNFNYPQKVAALGRFLDDYGAFMKTGDFTVTIAGTGLAWSSFRRRYEGRAEFPGYVRDVASLYAQHDVFVHFSGLDAFPYVVLEAQAAGLPVIVNRDCGMIEQVEEGLTGFVVDLDDRTQVEQRLLQLKESPNLRAELGGGAIEKVRISYSLRKIGEDLRRALGFQAGL